MLASPNIIKPEVYESKRIRLTSPILHIGGAVSRLNPFEYVQTTNKVYLPNQELLIKELKNKGRGYLDDYITAIEERTDINRLLKNAFGDNWREATAPNGAAIFPKKAISSKWTKNRITDLRPMIRNGMGELFIPGSSIKGAIRTAIAYYLLKYPERYQVPQQQQVSEIEKKLKHKLGDKKLKPKSADDGFMDSFFSDYTLTYQDRTFSGTKQNTDILRALQVTDSKPLLETSRLLKNGKKRPFNLPVVPEVIISSIFPDKRAKYRASIYVEMVKNVDTEFTLSLDTQMLSWFKHNQGMKLPFNNLDELLQICQEFAQEQWDYEHDYWNNIENNSKAAERNLNFSYIRDLYEPEECPYQLRLGWGSGMTGTTVRLRFDDELRKEIRDTCGLKAPDFEAPKSRRTIVNDNGDIRYVPGWVKFKVL